MSELEMSAVQTENVLIRAGKCTVTVLPQFGGKIASIRIGRTGAAAVAACAYRAPHSDNGI